MTVTILSITPAVTVMHKMFYKYTNLTKIHPMSSKTTVVSSEISLEKFLEI